MDAPDTFRYATGLGLVLASYNTWEVDVLTTDSGIISRAKVHGPRLPEVSTAARPQWVRWGYTCADQGQPWCEPIATMTAGPQEDRTQFMYYEKVGNFRIGVTRTGELDIINFQLPMQVRMQEANGGVIRFDTPNTSIVMSDSSESITRTAQRTITDVCQTETIEASIQVAVKSPDIELGDVPTDPVVLGNQLMTYLTDLVTAFNTHVHGSSVIPTPQQTDPPTALLSAVTKTQ